MRRAVLFPFRWMSAALLLCALVLPAAAQTPDETRTPVTVENAQNPRPADDPSMRADLEKMRAILNQMRNNLAFVGSTTTPLAHQFQLDIDMWQALLDHIEQRQEKEPPKQNIR